MLSVRNDRHLPSGAGTQSWSKIARERAKLVRYRCEVCGRFISLEKGLAHHVIRHPLIHLPGMPNINILANAEWACRACERRRHRTLLGNFLLKDRHKEMRQLHQELLAPLHQELFRLQLAVHQVVGTDFGKRLEIVHPKGPTVQLYLPPWKFHQEVLGGWNLRELFREWYEQQSGGYYEGGNAG